MSLTKVRMREGYTIDDSIGLTRDFAENPNSPTYQQTVWDDIQFPYGGAQVSGPTNRNFLYCTGWRKPSLRTQADFATPKYPVDGTPKMGEIGYVDLEGTGRVTLLSTDYGSAVVNNGYASYFLFTTTSTGDSQTVQIDITSDGHALLTRNRSEVSLCQFVVNDVFAGRYPGWYR